MSFASILGPSNNEPSPKISEAKQLPPRPATPPAKPFVETRPLPEKPFAPKLPEIGSIQSFVNGDIKPQPKMETVQVPRKYVPPPPPRVKPTQEEVEKISSALNTIDVTNFSDVESPGWSEHMQRYKQRIKKRAADVNEGEVHKRKVSDRFYRTVLPLYLTVRPHNHDLN